MFLWQPIAEGVRLAQLAFRQQTKAKQLIFGAFLACMATILQGAGNFLPGVGYFISPLATFPILIGAIFSLKMGGMSYLLTILLLFILAPSELFIFPLTTGLLGLGIGAAFFFFKKRISIIFCGALFLTSGITSLLYLFHFPILGPITSHSFSLLFVGGIFIFSLFYSWFWVEFSFYFFKKIKGRTR